MYQTRSNTSLPPSQASMNCNCMDILEQRLPPSSATGGGGGGGIFYHIVTEYYPPLRCTLNDPPAVADSNSWAAIVRDNWRGLCGQENNPQRRIKARAENVKESIDHYTQS